MINRVPLVSICKDVNHASCDRVSKLLPWLREGKMVPLLAGGGGEGGMGMGMGGARSYINHKYKAF